MPRQSINVDGQVVYRTRLMTYDRATSFRKCLRANSDFTAVEFCISDQTRANKCCFVRFQPASEDRRYDAIMREQDKRTAKALTEGAAYLYALDTDTARPFYWVFNPKSGEVYELDSSSCSCPDFHCRCRKLAGYGVRCKHLQRYDLAVQAGDLLPLSKVRIGIAVVPCQSCYGTGIFDQTEEPCHFCKGTGKREVRATAPAFTAAAREEVAA